ncbi:hypothetical protein BRC86_06905 [Halobacteriales archaeon QS_3_64_16]|nr:MAG: hypothetical protein BRC86_06905 [Halobacteriales archaeon QS_3_64_16]
MLTPGTLGLLEAMADGPLADLEPTIGDRGTITYPDAEAYLPDDERASRVLDGLADRGILDREFREKVHRCPECEPTELRYETVCPECGSPETRRETILEHANCGYAAPRERFDAEGRCPDCGDSFVGIMGEYATVGERHRCTACAWRFSEPEGRLGVGDVHRSYGPRVPPRRSITGIDLRNPAGTGSTPSSRPAARSGMSFPVEASRRLVRKG